ncbi:phage tail protein [Lactobacillus sp. M0390]|uniref:phage tail protein n=1 Tax=Lactobacillus sp. M0390 TaxID=2751026 RepID=UPI001436F285|nr:phage tail protein [Lactobacillus sp. M0390]MBH9986606.1 phage tail protein [Lactobacillus sp. M0390]QHJ81630.1 MAG: hypothetical protein [Caudoviricetes sp.]
MSSHGIKDVTFALLDDEGKLIKGEDGLSTTGIYLADNPGEGFTAVNFTGLETEGTPQFANDKIKRTSYGQPEPKVALTALDLDPHVHFKLIGYVSDGKGGYIRHLPKPHVAMLVHSRSLDNTIDIYEGVANCEIVEEASNHSTDNTNETDADTTLSATILTPRDKNVFVDPKDPDTQAVYKYWLSTDTGFDLAAIYREVFGGYSAVNNGSTPANSNNSSVLNNGSK